MRLKKTLLMFCAAWSLAPPVLAAMADTPWPTYNRDMKRTARTPAIGPAAPVILWRKTINDHWGTELRGATIAGDGQTIYVAAGMAGVYALNKHTGALKWKFHTESVGDAGAGGMEKWVEYPPTLQDDGTLHFPSEYGWTYALNPDGSLKWKAVSGKTEHAAAMDGDAIYFGSWDAHFYAYKTGPGLTDAQRLKWKYKFRGGASMTYGCPSIGDDGTVYMAYLGIYAFRPEETLPAGTDRLKWYTQVNQPSEGYGYYGPVIGPDGTLYWTMSTNLYAVGADGKFKWQFNTPGAVRGRTPGLAADGTIYFGSSDGNIYAINPNGTEKWRFKAANGGGYGGTKSNPIIDGNGVIYMYTTGDSGLGRLYALNPNGTEKWHVDTKVTPNGFPDLTLSMDANGTIYVPSASQEMLAVGAASGPVDTTPPSPPRRLRLR